LTFEKHWTGTESQTPAPKIEVFLPTNKTSSVPDYTFLPNTGTGAWSKLQNYNFTESVEDLEGTFSFATEYGEVNDVDIFAIIPIRAVIKIFEGADRPVFIGIIRRKKISKQMTSQGLRKTITFSGKSITSCIAEYNVSLDMKIQGIADAVSKQKELVNNLAKGSLTIKEFMIISWDYFREVSETAGISTSGLAEIINRHIGSPVDFINVTGSEQNIRYNIACIFFNAGNNSIANVWQNILPKDAYEIFYRCEKGKPKIIVRQVPFGDPENNCADWQNLDLYVIDPISLTAYDMDRNDENVYTVFASYILGSAMSREFYMAVNQDGNDETVTRNEDKMKIYGYKPMELTFNGYDMQGNTGDAEVDSLTKTIKKLNELAAYWYSRNDDMYQGSITVITDFKNPTTNPRVGCRAKFLGGEFYINKTEHSWVYLGTPTIKLSVSRGMVYDETGMMRDGENGIIQDIGRKYAELNRDPASMAAAAFPTFNR